LLLLLLLLLLQLLLSPHEHQHRLPSRFPPRSVLTRPSAFLFIARGGVFF
jgi:hypothetical protein